MVDNSVKQVRDFILIILIIIGGTCGSLIMFAGAIKILGFLYN